MTKGNITDKKKKYNVIIVSYPLYFVPNISFINKRTTLLCQNDVTDTQFCNFYQVLMCIMQDEKDICYLVWHLITKHNESMFARIVYHASQYLIGPFSITCHIKTCQCHQTCYHYYQQCVTVEAILIVLHNISFVWRWLVSFREDIYDHHI